jgi:hypothetical protein
MDANVTLKFTLGELQVLKDAIAVAEEALAERYKMAATEDRSSLGVQLTRVRELNKKLNP